MIRRYPKLQDRSTWRLLLGLLCLALVIVGSTVQVAHTHPGGDRAGAAAGSSGRHPGKQLRPEASPHGDLGLCPLYPPPACRFDRRLVRGPEYRANQLECRNEKVHPTIKG